MGSSSQPWSTCWYSSTTRKDTPSHDCVRRCPCGPSPKATGWLCEVAGPLWMADQQLCPGFLPRLSLESLASILAANPHIHSPSSACCLAGPTGEFLWLWWVIDEALEIVPKPWFTLGHPCIHFSVASLSAGFETSHRSLQLAKETGQRSGSAQKFPNAWKRWLKSHH